MTISGRANARSDTCWLSSAFKNAGPLRHDGPHPAHRRINWQMLMGLIDDESNRLAVDAR
jgi:hypothetical protein